MYTEKRSHGDARKAVACDRARRGQRRAGVGAQAQTLACHRTAAKPFPSKL